MNGSKPYGPSGDQQTSGEVPTRFTQPASPSPHPSPLPQGEGESSADFHQSLARCLADEPPEQPNLPPAVPSPRGGQGEGNQAPFGPDVRLTPGGPGISSRQ